MATATADIITLKIDTKPIERAFIEAPIPVYKHSRDFLDHSMRSFRKNFMQRTEIKLTGRSVAGINATPKPNKRFAFVFTVAPKQKAFPTTRAAVMGFQQLKAEAYTNREAMQAHEVGATITARGKLLRIPVRFPGTPAPGKGKQIVRATGRGQLMVFERVRKRTGERVRAEFTRTGKMRKNQRKTQQDVLVPRAVLRRRVQLKPKLHFYRTWGELDSDRAQKWSDRCDRILSEVARRAAT